MSNSERKSAAHSAVAAILNESSGFELSELDPRAPFSEFGFDSLFLVQFSQKIKARLKVTVTFRQLLEEIPNLGALIDHVAAHLPDQLVTSTESAAADSRIAVAPTPDPASRATSQPLQPPAVKPSPSAPVEEMASPGTKDPKVVNPIGESSGAKRSESPTSPVPAAGPSGRAALAEIIAQQNQLMSLQLELLSGTAGNRAGQRTTGAVTPAESTSIHPDDGVASSSPTLAERSPSLAAGSVPGISTEEERVSASLDESDNDRTGIPEANKADSARFGPYKPVRQASDGGLTETQQQHLHDFVSSFIQRTSKSRQHAQQHRSHFADPRGVAGYRRIWKSMVYQIVVERSRGSKLWDIDGNEYIDIAMGFGLNLFGQSPEFITNAVQQQLTRGVEVGPQSPLAGEVAQLLCDFSRKDRATFCNTGSEAVMAALRLARTVTARPKIVFFNKDYHGNFDQVLIRSTKIRQQRRSQPAAPGVPQPLADMAIVLDYGTDEALETIREQADDIAAVLVEPVQSADPFIQPREFLHKLREITREHEIALIMDEVITGFRAAQGGAQEWFDVWADMATYGKILGGGLPIGALAGSSKYMDALDGGDWNYEDDSEPTADMTFFAGTFVRHPLAMAAAHQVLMKVKEEGPELQERLTQKTNYLVESLNNYFTTEQFPFRLAQFGSLFRFMFPPAVEYADLLYFHLLHRGIFTRGWGDNCFLSTAHTDQDVEQIVAAVKESCQEIRAGGFMPKPQTSVGSDSVATVYSQSEQSPGSPSVTAQPAAIAKQHDQLSTVEVISEQGDLPPLFCMPAADGLTLVFHELASRLGDRQPVYGLNSPGAYGEPVPHTIEEMATRFVHDMRLVQPHGPYLLMGYCSGGSIAFESAQQLVAAGEEVAFLCGIETYDWGTAQSSKPTFWVKTYFQWQRLEFIVRNFLLLNGKEKREFMRAKIDRIRSRTAYWKGSLAGLFSRRTRRVRPSRGGVNWDEVWRQHDAQADRYVPRPYPGKLLLIRPKRDYRSYVGKQDLRANQGVKIVRMPAFPAGLMTPPFVDHVAELVRSGIDEGLRECGANTDASKRATQTSLAGDLVAVQTDRAAI